MMNEEGGSYMGLQEEWEKAGSTEETMVVEETLFKDDLSRVYRFDSRGAPHLEIEVVENSSILRVRYIEKGE